MDENLTEKTLTAYTKEAERKLIDSAKLQEWITAHRFTESSSTTSTIDTVQWEEYAPGYARKRARSKSREEQLEEKEEFEGLGEPFTPPISTEDVTGL